MALVVPKMGLRSFLGLIPIHVTSLEMHLYQNDVTPVYGTQTIELVECDYSGYAPVTVSGWTAPAEEGDNVHWSIESGPFDFLAGTGPTTNPVYGWYCLTPGGDIELIERFSLGPFTMGAPGQTLSVNVIFTDRSEY